MQAKILFSIASSSYIAQNSKGQCEVFKDIQKAENFSGSKLDQHLMRNININYL